MVVQPDGKTVAVGTGAGGEREASHFGLVRYNPNGSLDGSFGGVGAAVTPSFYGPADGSGSNGDTARSVALDANNKIVVAGDASDNNALGALAVARYNTNGTLDTSFGTNGQALVRVGDGSYNMGEGMTIEPNGKIVVVGIYLNGWAVARFTSGGVLDTTFNPSGSQPGVQEFSLGDSFFDDAYAVTTEVVNGQTDIVVGGTAAHNPAAGDGAGDEDFAVVRFTDAGAFDSGFGTNGVVKTDFGGNADQISSILVQPNGKILAVGQAGNAGGADSVAFARYNADGTLDTSFNSTGRLTSIAASGTDAMRGLGLLSDGSILAAATATSGSGDVELEKLTPTGQLDTTFGTFGVTTTNVGQDQANALAVDPTDGRVVVAGSDRTDASHQSFEVERYTDVAAPTITTNPTAQNACGTGSATFTVSPAATSPYAVQWQVSTNGGASFADLANGGGVSGATTTSLHLTGLTSADNGKQFRAVITDGGGTVTSGAATLTAGTAPSITTNPTSQTRSDGAPVSFTAAASGDPAATVQWSVSTNGGTTYTPIGGATSTTYSTTAALAANGNKYEATFTNGCGSATTTPATLTVSAVTAHELEVSQFRLAGGSTADWYVDVRNTTSGVVNTSGWTASIETAPGTETPVALPAGTIPANGSVLLAGTGYSLSAYAAADGTSAITPLPGGGVALIGPNGTVTDRAGMAGSDAAVHSGTGLTTPNPSDAQLAYVRTASGTGLIDTDNNAADFTLVATDADTNTHSAGAVYGAPGPQDLAGPVPNISSGAATLVAPGVSANTAPNRVVTGSTMVMNRVLTNKTGATVHQLRLRITSITTIGNTTASQAQLQVQNASSSNVTLDSPPSGVRGGLGSTLTVTLPGGGLAPGGTVQVGVAFQIVRGGSFSVVWVPEAK